MSDPVVDDFVLRAQAVTVTEAAAMLDVRIPKGDKGQPCPQCGGKDRFSINATKQVWNCRGCGNGGRTGIGLAGHVLRYDLHSRSGFLEACSAVLGEQIPEGGERESAEERVAREARMAESRARIEAEAAERERAQNDFRAREMERARGIYFHAKECQDGSAGARVIGSYLRRRTGYVMPDGIFANIRFDERHTYWHGVDDLGRVASHYVGTAMVAPFVDLDGRVTGCHETWIDLRNGPKFRPDLGLDEKGEPLTTKKMRGTKKGSLIPVLGDMAALRWLGGEGIETVAAVAGYEGFRADTFYFAAGDLGNLSGPADRRAGRSESHVADNGKKVRVHPFPKPDQDKGEAIQLPPHVAALVLLADGDSEFYFTAAAMARAKARLAREGRSISIWWPPQGKDFASLLSERA